MVEAPRATAVGGLACAMGHDHALRHEEEVHDTARVEMVAITLRAVWAC